MDKTERSVKQMTMQSAFIGAAFLMAVSVLPSVADNLPETDFASQCLKEASAPICECMATLIGNTEESEEALSAPDEAQEQVAGVPADTWIDAYTACLAALP